MSFKENKNCLVCTTPIQHQYLNLTDQPLANSYHHGEKLSKYPLELSVCTNCWHSQLTVSVDPTEMFDHYLYISDTSRTLTEYFKNVTNYIVDKMPQAKSVLEIACNSGLLLEMFQSKGLLCYGIDPAKNIRTLSQARNLNVYVDYWNNIFAENFKNTVGSIDLILAFHVLPHVPDPNEFISSCLTVLNENGTIFLQTSQCDMFLNNEFDVVYHEHSSYFTASSIRELARRHNLYVSSIIKTDIHGKSFLFSFTRSVCDESQLNMLIADELSQGMYSIKRYSEFAQKAEQTKTILTSKLNYYREHGYTLIGYGAAAKGNTLLNYLNYKLDYIIDDNNMKWGYLTPGMNIPIHGINLLDQPFEKICFIPLAWNFYSEIKERIQQVRNTDGDIFIKYFPEYQEEQ